MVRHSDFDLVPFLGPAGIPAPVQMMYSNPTNQTAKNA
jgi:hypothetical protein